MKQILITALVIVAIIGGAILFGKDDSGQVSGQTSNNFYGNENGIVTLVEYGDFQCPACAGFYPVVKQVKEQFKDELRFEFKHFPLVQIHPNATAAHRAAQAAANQGKFWEMHDTLYEQQNSWNSSSSPAGIFEQYARELGLDMERYSTDVNGSEVLGVINADIEAGKQLGANSTPTFVLDGEVITDLTAISTLEGFSKLIQDKINEKTGGSNTSEEPAKPEE